MDKSDLQKLDEFFDRLTPEQRARVVIAVGTRAHAVIREHCAELHALTVRDDETRREWRRRASQLPLEMNGLPVFVAEYLDPDELLIYVQPALVIDVRDPFDLENIDGP